MGARTAALESHVHAATRARNVARGVEVLTAIDFDDQLGFEAGEIHDVRTNLKLTSKPVAKKLSAPQMMP